MLISATDAQINSDKPVIGKQYKIIDGPFKGEEGLLLGCGFGTNSFWVKEECGDRFFVTEKQIAPLSS